jgi:transcriptional regulator with XRE-family HTH domain
MAEWFGQALLWHMDKHGTTVPQLADGAGVSRDVVLKLRSRKTVNTTAVNAARIAAFYGKDVTAFLRCEDSAGEQSLEALLDLLTEEERRGLTAQVRGILSNRGTQ